MFDLSTIARHRRRPAVRFAAQVCERFLDAFHNLDYRAERNGEEHVVHTLAQFDVRTVFDVGANLGQWALMAERLLPRATIHAFEIAPETFAGLVRNTDSHPRIVPNNFGLGRASAVVNVRYSPSAPESATTTAYPLPADCRSVEARVRSGDEYARELGISHIDLLKIDVEGMEADVLDGFDGMLERRAIDVIQFEYGRVNLLTGHLLRSFFERLGAFGYALGKIYPTYVDFRPYRFTDEDFRGPNYLAVRESRPDLLEALGAS